MNTHILQTFIIMKHSSFIEIEGRLRRLNVRVELLEQRELILAVPPRVVGNGGRSYGRRGASAN